jgi:ketosteroid isomerase-like protein
VQTFRAASVLLVFAAMLVCAPCHGQEQITPKQRILDWAKALDSGKLGQILAFYAESDDLVAIASSGQLSRGFAAVKKEYARAFRDVTALSPKPLA